MREMICHGARLYRQMSRALSVAPQESSLLNVVAPPQVPHTTGNEYASVIGGKRH